MSGRLWQRGSDGQIRRVPTPAASPGAGPPRPSPWRALGQGIRAAYDSLGTALLMSVVWSVSAGAVLMGGWALGLAVQGTRGRAMAAWLLHGGGAVAPGGVAGDGGRLVLASIVPYVLWSLVVGPVTAGVVGFVRDLFAREYPGWADLVGWVRAQLGPAARLAAVQGALTLILAMDVLFFAAQPLPGLRVVGMLFVYPLLFWLLALPYQWPLLVEQRQGAWSAVKKSLLLVLDNPVFALVVGAVTGLLSVACLVSMVGMPLLWAGTLAFLHTAATRTLLRKYGLLPPEPDPAAADEGWPA